MGVELGSSITALGNGPAVSLGSLFPERATATFTTVTNLDTGPVGGWGKGLAAPEPFAFGSRNGSSLSFAEGPTMFNPVDQINLNSQSELNAVDAVLEAESILAQAARPQIGEMVENPDFSVAALVAIYGQTESKIASLVDYGLMPDFQPAAKIDSEIYTQVVTQPQTETEVQAQSSQTVTAPNVQKQIVGEIEITGIEIKQEQATALHVIDKKAAANRIIRILARALQIVAKSGVSQKIKGADLAVGLPTSNKQEIRGGEINSKDPNEKIPDNTWDATLEQLRGLVFDSIRQIRAKVPKVVFDNHPVIVAKEGDVASSKNIARSHYQQVVAEGVIQDYPELSEALKVS